MLEENREISGRGSGRDDDDFGAMLFKRQLSYKLTYHRIQQLISEIIMLKFVKFCCFRREISGRGLGRDDDDFGAMLFKRQLSTYHRIQQPISKIIMLK